MVTHATSGAAAPTPEPNRGAPQVKGSNLQATVKAVNAVSEAPLAAPAQKTQAPKEPTGAPIKDSTAILLDQYPRAVARYKFARDSNGHPIIDPKKCTVLGKEKVDLVKAKFTTKMAATFIALQKANVTQQPGATTGANIFERMRTLTEAADLSDSDALTVMKDIESWLADVDKPGTTANKEYHQFVKELVDLYDGSNFHSLDPDLQDEFFEMAVEKNPLENSSFESALIAIDMYQYMDDCAQEALNSATAESPQHLSSHRISNQTQSSPR